MHDSNQEHKNSQSKNSQSSNSEGAIDLIDFTEIPSIPSAPSPSASSKNSGCCWSILCLMCTAGFVGTLYGGIKELNKEQDSKDQAIEGILFAVAGLCLIFAIVSGYQARKTNSCYFFNRRPNVTPTVTTPLTAVIESHSLDNRPS